MAVAAQVGISPMIELPSSLSTWRRELAIFPPDVALTLGRLVQRIAPALGPLGRANAADAGEPDGFGGVARRGSYERLLTSEWAMGELSADEFLRRAAFGEHAFLELAHREPARPRTCVALFECGPEALGAPRIAALAILIVLSQRAEVAGASLAWQLLHAFGGDLLPGVSRATVNRLIQGRTHLRADQFDVESWTREIGAGELDELWIVGSPRMAQAATSACASAIAVEDVLDPEARRLRLTIQRGRNGPRQLLLNLPDDSECARLLRDPFSQAVAPRAQTPWVPCSDLVFASNLRKLFARDASGAIVAYPIPNSPRAGIGRPKRYRPRSGKPVIAVGWWRKCILMATSGSGDLTIESPTNRAGWGLPSRFALPAELESRGDGGPLRYIAAWCAGNAVAPPLFLVIAADGRLLELAPPERITRVAEQCTLLAPLSSASGGFVFVGRRLERVSGSHLDQWRIVWLKENGERATLRLEGDGDFAAVVGRAQRDTYGTLGVRQHARIWTLRWGDRSMDLDPGEAEVIGVIDGSNRDDDPGLVLLEQQSLVAVSRSWSRPVARSKRVVRAAVSPSSTHLAYLTDDRVLTIVELPSGTVLARFDTGAVAKADA